MITAQARVAVAAAVTAPSPALRRAARAVSGEPVVDDVRVAGVPAVLARPPGRRPVPALVFVNGVTARGRRHPAAQYLAYGLARAGFLVAAPDPPGLTSGPVSEATLSGLVRACRAIADRDDVEGGRIGLMGVSMGASLALLAAAEPELEGRVSVVAGTAPYTDLGKVVQLATTGFYDDDGRLQPYPADPFMGLIVGRSVAAVLPVGTERDLLADRLAGVPDHDPDPLAALRTLDPTQLSAGGRAVLTILLNRDPARFPELHAELPESSRGTLERLSPITHAERLGMPIEVASSPRDKYFPLAESRALVRAAPRARLTVTPMLAHAIPEPSALGVQELIRLDAWAVRVLRSAVRFGDG